MKKLKWLFLLVLLCVPLACTKNGAGPVQSTNGASGPSLDLRANQASAEQAAIREMIVLQKQLEREQELDE